jgi:hypothetical protein
VTINVVPQSIGTITNSAEVSATEPDPNPVNNSETRDYPGQAGVREQPCLARAGTGKTRPKGPH